MLILAYDSETTGLPLFDQPSDDERQPHIVQIGAILADAGTGRVEASLDMIARPDGWDIPDDVADIHGVTTERAARVGLPEAFIVHCLWCLWEQADLRVAHNESFDARILRIALKRHFGDEPLPPGDKAPADIWKAGKAECTARQARPLMKMPATAAMKAAGRKQPKMPKLSEAYEHFCGKPLEGAHNAMVDARACLDIWLAMRADVVDADEPPAPESTPAAGDDGVPFLGGAS
ncbi:MAG: 3'-5' exonuclease [Salinisphaeraceae bacterium]